MTTKPEEKVAEAIEKQADSEAAIAEAVSDEKKGEATESIVAAASGAAALAQVESAKAIQNAGEKISETEERIAWLGTQTESLQNQIKEVDQKSDQRYQPMQEALARLATGFEQLTSKLSAPAKTASEEAPATNLKGADAARDQDDQEKTAKQKRTIRRI